MEGKMERTLFADGKRDAVCRIVCGSSGDAKDEA
jgi:hypothetical protein